MFIIYCSVGAIAGVMSGLLGIGGGVVIIPALAALFADNAFIPADYIMKMAVGTSLGIVIMTAASAMYAQNKRNMVVWSMVKTTMPGLIVGAILGALVAHVLPSSYLSRIFSVFLVVVSLRILIKRPEQQDENPLSQKAMHLFSLLIGGLSSILGVGGGTLLVPFLLRCKLDVHKAVGTSVACGLTIGIVATICFMITGFAAGAHLPWSTGYIYWPAFVGISMMSIVFAPLGAVLAHKLPKAILQKIFAIFLLLMAFNMMFFSRG